MNYPVPVGTARSELLVKKSRFIAISGHCDDQSRLHPFISQIANEFPDARHLCHACIIGAPRQGSASCSDDGEPVGTAGKPILNVLQHSGIGNIVTVVVRYFGGIKLGAGGLVRAYSGAASGCIKLLDTKTEEALCPLEFIVEFSRENEVRHLLLQFNAREIQTHYDSRLILQCQVPCQSLNDITSQLNNVTRGNISFKEQ